jgi:hypothetical protein
MVSSEIVREGFAADVYSPCETVNFDYQGLGLSDVRKVDLTDMYTSGFLEG